MKAPRISMIVALGTNRAMGIKNALLWHLPNDLKRFKALTTGHAVIMGRKTFESVLSYLKKPFPNRTSIVISRNREYTYEGVIVVDSLEAALKKANKYEREEIFVIGGAQIYELALPKVNRIYLTLVEDAPEADTYFPDYSDFSKIVERSDEQEEGGIKYTWMTLERE